MKSIITVILFVSISTINAQVTQEWVSRYNEPGNGEDYARSIAVDGSGNVYVTGRSRSMGSVTNDDYATIKYNSTGIEQWAERYNGPENGNDWAYSIAVDGLGNVYVTGLSGGVSDDYATIKYNSSGDSVWISRYDGPSNCSDYAYSIAVDGSGNVYVTGKCDVGLYDEDYATIKYNSSGVEQWVSRYDGPGNADDNAYSIAVDGSGNVYVTGQSWGSGTGWDYATIKYNSTGIEQWAERYNGPGNGNDVAYSIAVDGSGNVYVTGESFGSGTSSDYATIKYNSSGVEQWVSRYNGPGNGNDGAYSIAVDDSGNVYVTGGNYVSQNDGDYATIKYNSSRVEQWVQRYNGPGNSGDWALSIALDGSGNVYVTGGSIGSETYYDYATIKYSQTTGVYQTTSDLPENYSLSQNYPNPFNPSTTIEFTLSSRSFVSLKVFDVIGKEVAVLVSEDLSAGNHRRQWNATNMPNGVYFYCLQAGSFIETKTLVLLK